MLRVLREHRHFRIYGEDEDNPEYIIVELGHAYQPNDDVIYALRIDINDNNELYNSTVVEETNHNNEFEDKPIPAPAVEDAQDFWRGLTEFRNEYWTMTEYKQAIILRRDLDMSPGKAVAQGAHVSVKATGHAPEQSVENWEPSMAKITLAADDQEHLEFLYDQAIAHELPVSIIADEGRTELESNTLTAIAIGPAPATEVNKITSSLSLY